MNTNFWKTFNGQFGDHVEKELEALLSGNDYIHYNKDMYNSPYTFNDYGDTKNNVLYMTVERDGKKIFGRISSCVAWPAMVDRIGFLDAFDAQHLDFLAYMMIRVTFENWSEEDVLTHWDKLDAKHKENLATKDKS